MLLFRNKPMTDGGMQSDAQVCNLSCYLAKAGTKYFTELA